MDTYLVDCVNKILRIIPREVTDHLDLSRIREDGRYERDAFIRDEGTVNQSSPGRTVTTGDDRSQANGCITAGINEKLTE